MTEPSNSEVPRPQLEAAFRLAKAHKHLWAGIFASLREGVPHAWDYLADKNRRRLKDALEAYFDGTRQTLSPKLIQETVLAVCSGDEMSEYGYWGENAPQYQEEDGTITHRTGTLRLSWKVFPMGNTRLDIHRKDIGVILSAETPKGVINAYCREFNVRHVESLGHAMRALGLEMPAKWLARASDFQEKLNLAREGWVDASSGRVSVAGPEYKARMERAESYRRYEQRNKIEEDRT